MKARNAKQTGNGGQASKVSSISTARERRLNYGRLPKPSNGEVAYANAREELAGLTLGEKVAIVTESAAWQLVMVPKLNSLAEERSRRGGGHAYSTEELEAAHLYRLMAGCRTWTAAREKLAGDRSKRCRVALDLTARGGAWGRTSAIGSPGTACPPSGPWAAPPAVGLRAPRARLP